MNKVDKFIESFISESILFFKTNFLGIACPKKFHRIAYARSKREKFLIQNKYLFFFISCFFFFLIQTILEINIRDIFKFLFSNRLYFIDYQSFLNHIKANILNYKFNVTEIFYFIFPIGFIPLIIAWTIIKLLKVNKYYCYIVYFLSFQINAFTISVIIFAASFAIINSPFTALPYILSALSFSIFFIYIFLCFSLFMINNYREKVLYKQIMVILLLASNIFLLSESINLKNRFNKFLQKKASVAAEFSVINHQGGKFRIVTDGKQTTFNLTVVIFNHTDDNLIIVNDRFGSMQYKSNGKIVSLNLMTKQTLINEFITNIPAGEAIGVDLFANLSMESLTGLREIIAIQKTKNIIFPTEIKIVMKSGKGKKIEAKRIHAYRITDLKT